MTFLQNITLTALVPILKAVLSVVTPDLKAKLDNFVTDWYKAAKGTPNPFDDIAAAFLLAMLDLPTPADVTAADLAGKLDASLTK